MKTIIFNGQNLSKLALGTVQFGLNYGINNAQGQPNTQSVTDILDYVTEQGINCLDTAQAYGDSEAVLGATLSAFARKNVLLISKIQSEPFVQGGAHSIEPSLQRLRTPQLFALLLHDAQLLPRWQDEYTHIVNQWKADAKIRYFGVSIYTSAEFELALANDAIQVIQIPFNLFDQRAWHEQRFERAHAAGKLLFIRSVFLQGLLLMQTRDLPPHLQVAQNYLLRLDELCAKTQLTRQELALSFVESIAQGAVMLFGCETLAQAQDNIATYNHLTPLDTDTLNDIQQTFAHIPASLYNPALWNNPK